MDARPEIKVRVAPALRRAVKAQARAAGVSMNSFVVHVLAAAVGAELFRAGDAVDGPVPGADGTRGPAPRRPHVVAEARSIYRDHLFGTGGARALLRPFSDEEALAYYDDVWLPSRGG